MSDAMEIILRKEPIGFRVSFEWKEGCLLRSDYFPEHDEKLIPTEQEAWDLAGTFAKKMKGKVVHVYVTDHQHNPVPDYNEKLIENR